ncbi:hypothetical protein [Kribbella sp. NPDC004875]|uniref:hypothetical protein n=1 Tax=Kribbella sp. NPDC004875 TaxID=3364107 RepID=UPI0036A429B8
MSETRRSSGADGPAARSAYDTLQNIRLYCLYLTTMAGLVCAIGSWGVGGTAISVVVIGMAAGVIAASVAKTEGSGEFRRIARVTLASALVAPAAMGLIAVLGFTGVLIGLLFAVTTPALLSKLPRRQPEKKARPTAPPPLPPQPSRSASSTQPPQDTTAPSRPAHELDALDDQALCWAWRRSFRLLEAAPSAIERLSVVVQRQQYLDELHRRSPEGLAAWLASGARASGNPLPYVEDARRRAN